MDLGLKPGDYGYKASQNEAQLSDTRTTTAKEQSLESRVEQLETTVKTLTETIKSLQDKLAYISQVAHRVKTRTQTDGGG